MRKNNYDEIRIENLEFFANHGVYPEETRLGQKFMISLTMYTDTRRAGRTDELESSTNYGEVSHFIVDFMAKHTCQAHRRLQRKSWQRHCCLPIRSWPE